MHSGLVVILAFVVLVEQSLALNEKFTELSVVGVCLPVTLPRLWPTLLLIRMVLAVEQQ